MKTITVSRKRTLLAVVSVIVTWICASPVTYGQEYIKRYDFTDFDRIEIVQHNQNNWRHFISGNACRIEVNIIRSEEFMVELHVEEERFSGLYAVEQAGNTLKIISFHIPENSGKVKEAPTAELTVRMPAFRKMDISGIARVSMSGEFTAEDVAISMKGATGLEGLDIKSGAFLLDASGATEISHITAAAGTCTVTASGAAKISGMDIHAESGNCIITASGAASISGMDIYAGNASMTMKGASRADIGICADSFRVSTGGAGRIHAEGEVKGTMNVDASGASSVRAENVRCGNAIVTTSGAASVKVNTRGDDLTGI